MGKLLLVPRLDFCIEKISGYNLDRNQIHTWLLYASTVQKKAFVYLFDFDYRDWNDLFRIYLLTMGK